MPDVPNTSSIIAGLLSIKIDEYKLSLLPCLQWVFKTYYRTKLYNPFKIVLASFFRLNFSSEHNFFSNSGQPE